jgi:type VI secretion system secreted protein Hcp
MHVGRVQNGKFMPLIVYKMENAMISRISTSGSSGIPSDSFSLNFTKLQADYTQQASASTPKGSATFNWDLETAKST